MRDTKLFDLIEKEKIRQTEGIELIASENYASEDVMAAAGSILTNKYAEGLPEKDIMVDAWWLTKLKTYAERG